jgi:hypothetical protein
LKHASNSIEKGLESIKEEDYVSREEEARVVPISVKDSKEN